MINRVIGALSAHRVFFVICVAVALVVAAALVGHRMLYAEDAVVNAGATNSCKLMALANRNVLEKRADLIQQFMANGVKGMDDSMSASCIGDIAGLNIDLSGGISIDSAIDALISAAVNKVNSVITNAVCGAVGDVRAQWDSLAYGLNAEYADLVGSVQVWK